MAGEQFFQLFEFLIGFLKFAVSFLCRFFNQAFGFLELAIRFLKQPPDIIECGVGSDFSQTLIREISPGKVLKRSARAAKLYLMRLSVTVGFRDP